jgi:hypothetical protein
MLALVLSALVWVLVPADPQALAAHLVPEHVAFTKVADSAPMRWAHRVLLLFIALCVLLAPRLLPGAKEKRATRQPEQLMAGAAFFLAVGTAFVFDGGAMLWGLGCAILALGLLWSADKITIPSKLLFYAAAALGVVFILPGVFYAPTLVKTAPGMLEVVEWHLALLLGPGTRLALGERLFDTVPLGYGVLWPTLSGTLQKALGIFSAAAQLRWVGFFNLLFFALSLFALRLQYRRGPGLFIGVLCVLPFIGAFGESVLFPNQSGLRFLGFALAAFLLALSHHQKEMRALLFTGLGAGLCLLWNLETGIVVLIGFLVRAYFRRGVMATWPKKAGVFFGAMCVVLLIWFFLHRIGLGEFPLPDSLGELFAAISLGSSGGISAKAPERIHFASLLFFASAFFLLEVALKKKTSKRAATRAAFSSMVLVFFAYYANRGDAWNLWTLLFLSAFVWERALFPARLVVLGKRLREGKLPAGAFFIAVFALFGGTQLAQTHGAAWSRFFQEASLRQLVKAQGADFSEKADAAGLKIPPIVATALHAKAAALKKHPEAGRLTANAFFLPILAERGGKIPLGHAFGETHTQKAYADLMQWLLQEGPKHLLVDDPNFPVPRKGPQMDFLRRLRGDLLKGGFEEGITQSGWVHLHKK